MERMIEIREVLERAMRECPADDLPAFEEIMKRLFDNEEVAA